MQQNIAVVSTGQKEAFLITEGVIFECLNDGDGVDSRSVCLDKPNLTHIATHFVSVFVPVNFWNVPQLETASSVGRHKSRTLRIYSYLSECVNELGVVFDDWDWLFIFLAISGHNKFDRVDVIYLHRAQNVFLRLQIPQIPKSEFLVCWTRNEDTLLTHDEERVYWLGITNVLFRNTVGVLLMKIKLYKSCLEVPRQNSTVMTTSKDQVGREVISSRHYIITVGLLSRVVGKVAIRQITTCFDVLLIRGTIIRPNSKTFVPTCGHEEWRLFTDFFLAILWWRFADTQKLGDFFVDLGLFIGTKKVLERWTVTEIPNFDSSIRASWHHSSLSWVECTSRQLVSFSVGITEFGQLATIFNIPDSDESVVRPRNYIFKLCVVEGKCYRSIMGSLWLFLSFEEPEIDLARA